MADTTPTPPDGQKTPAGDNPPDAREQNLRIQELQLKVDALKIPEWRKMSTWTGIVAIAAAVFSFIVQGYYYKIQNAQAILDLREANTRLDSVTKAEAGVRTRLRLTRDSARADGIALVGNRALMASATHELDSITRKFQAIKANMPKQPGDPNLQDFRLFDQLVKNTKQTLTTQVESVPIAKPNETATAPITGSEGGHAAVADDPQKNQWGGLPERNGRKMSATVKEIAYHTYRIVITVTSTDPSRPLRGDVTFHLHNTFRNQTPVVAATDNEAVLSLVAVGSFTVGAETDGGKTKLEFDLVNATGADEYFKKH